MRWLACSMLLAVCCALAASAQEAELPKPKEPVKYFLIDASGSMKGENASAAEEEVQKILAPMQAAKPNGLVSRTYFRAENRDLCSHPVKISPAIPASRSAPQFPSSGNNDYTPLGAALVSAIASAGSGPAEIFIISDEVQSPDCGPDICEIAQLYLPIDGVDVTAIAIGEDAKAAGRLKCIDEAENETFSQQVSEIESPTATTAAMPVSWDDEGWWERWLWLVIALTFILSAGFFAFGYALKANAYESETESIRERQRLMLAGQGDKEQHQRDIEGLKQFAEPTSQGWIARSIIVCVVATLLLAVLLFFDGSHFGYPLGTDDRMIFVELRPARALGWKVVSSDFANAFAILCTTPLIFAFAQYWRYTQAKRTFSIASGEAAEEAAKRRLQEIGFLFGELNEVRSSIARTNILTPWAKVPIPIASLSRPRTEAFASEDLANLEIVKDKLRTFAQQPVPSILEMDRDKLAARIKALKRYGPRVFLGERWGLAELIEDLDEKGLLDAAVADWRQLAQSVKKLDNKGIKAALRRLVNEAPV